MFGFRLSMSQVSQHCGFGGMPKWYDNYRYGLYFSSLGELVIYHRPFQQEDIVSAGGWGYLGASFVDYCGCTMIGDEGSK